jgi:pyruvate dehydrogenase E1 component
VPNCRAFDPAYAYELAVILHDGMQRMLTQQEDVFYYITVMNENYAHPALPDGAREGILRGMYRVKRAEGEGERVQLLGSGTILREALAASELLRDDFQIDADIWSVTSFSELRRQGNEVERWNLLHPSEPQRLTAVEECLADRSGPVIAATDWVRAVPEQIRPYVPARYRTLGTDGFGRSDGRERLRHFFEVNRFFIALAALKALSDDGRVPPARVREAIEKYGLDPAKPDPARS